MEALTCFFVFNPTLGTEADDSDRILYFFPSKGFDINTQCGYIGLISGMVNFAKDFSSTPAQSLQTECNRYAFVECEKDIWFALALRNPRKDSKQDHRGGGYSRRSHASGPISNLADASDASVGGAGAGGDVGSVAASDLASNAATASVANSSLHAHGSSSDPSHAADIPKSDLSPESHLPRIESDTYLETEFRDSVLLTILRSAHSTFQFFHGPMDHIIVTQGYDALRKKLRLFFEYYLPTVQFHQLRYFSDLFGFRFFAVDRTTYLTLQYLHNSVQWEHPRLHSMSVMYNGKLIWSGISQEDMRVLYASNQEPFNSYIYTFMARYNALLARERDSLKSGANKGVGVAVGGGGGGGDAKHGQQQQQQQIRASKLEEMRNDRKKKNKVYYRDTATAAEESNYQKFKPKQAPRDKSQQRWVDQVEKERRWNGMEGQFVTGPLSREFYSEETPIVYVSGYKKFYRLICYKLRKLCLFWLMDDDSLEQPMLDDAFDSILNSLDLGDENIAQKVEQKTDQTNANADQTNGSKSESPSFGPLADDVTAKYFGKLSKKDGNDSGNEEYEGMADAVKGLGGAHKHGMSESLQEAVEFYQKLQKFIEPQCEEITKELERHEKRQNSRKSKTQGQSHNFRFLYFNHQNLALKAVLKAPGKKLSTDTCRTLRNIRSDFKRSSMAISDVCAKCADGWVVARKSYFGGRELYLLVDNTEASNLTELQDHMDALEEEYFSNIFML